MPEFTLDPFQKQAIEHISAGHSVLVSAPTGSGKTVIAEYAIESALKSSRHVIYTAPIKALSNQKFRDFKARYGEETVGIVTGDVSINPEAPILIMTTEIYRNCLFENSERINQIGWVIFDEIHYLDDPGRGTVWEEAILFSPQNIRILALSATVPNIHQLAAWIHHVHNQPVEIVEESHRPVPLSFFFQCQGRLMKNEKQLFSQGFFNRDSWRLSHRERRRGLAAMFRAKPNRLDTLITHFQETDRLPAIYFVFGRKRAEELALEAAQFDFLSHQEKTRMNHLYHELLERYGLTSEKSALDLSPLVERGIAYHHAGMLPTLKEVVEQLFTQRMIKLIFTTETFALGINMPARSVVFDELEKYYDTGFQALTTRDFYQMAGRAGRRGMDSEGFVYIRVNPNHICYSEVHRILHGKPESITSQLNTAYATILNLYKSLGNRLLEIYPKTFHHFQSSHKKRSGGFQLIQNKLDMLKAMDYMNDSGLTAKGEFASSVFGYELSMGEMHGEGVLDNLNEIQLNVLLSGLIFEPRKSDHLPKLNDTHKKMRLMAEHYSKSIYRHEYKYKVTPYTKMVHFHLAPAVEAWSRGANFDRTLNFTTTAEGELVRHLRMIIQLLRELTHGNHVSQKLKHTAEKARGLINRDVVDAERQLRA